MTRRDTSVWGSAAPAPAVLRAGRILDLIAAADGRPCSPARLAADAGGVPRASVVNICAALVRTDLVSAVEGGFVLGPALLRLSRAYLDTLDPVRQFHEQLRRLPGREETFQLGTLDANDVVYLAVHEGATVMRLTSKVGSRLPATCTALGKAMLARHTDAEIGEALGEGPLVAMTPWSITDAGRFLDTLQEVRAAGFAVDDQETSEGIVCVAVAVPSPAGQPFAVSSSVLRSSATPERIAGLVEAIRAVVNGMGQHEGASHEG